MKVRSDLDSNAGTLVHGLVPSAAPQPVELPALALGGSASALVAAEHRSRVVGRRGRWAVVDEALGRHRGTHPFVDDAGHLEHP